jgi:hypothetical protein
VVDDDRSQQPQVALFPARPTRDELAERDLLVILFTACDLSAEVQAEIQPDEVTNPHLRQVYEICLRIGEHGGIPSYEGVTVELGDAGLKSLAARIVEHARGVVVTPELIAQTLEHFRRRREVRPPSRAALSGPHGADPTTEGPEHEAKARLREVLESQRRRAMRTTLK